MTLISTCFQGSFFCPHKGCDYSMENDGGDDADFFDDVFNALADDVFSPKFDAEGYCINWQGKAARKIGDEIISGAQTTCCPSCSRILLIDIEVSDDFETTGNVFFHIMACRSPQEIRHLESLNEQ